MSVYKPYSAKPKDQLTFKIYFTKTKVNAKFFQLDTGNFRKFYTIHIMLLSEQWTANAVANPT